MLRVGPRVPLNTARLMGLIRHPGQSDSWDRGDPARCPLRASIRKRWPWSERRFKILTGRPDGWAFVSTKVHGVVKKPTVRIQGPSFSKGSRRHRQGKRGGTVRWQNRARNSPLTLSYEATPARSFLASTEMAFRPATKTQRSPGDDTADGASSNKVFAKTTPVALFCVCSHRRQGGRGNRGRGTGLVWQAVRHGRRQQIRLFERSRHAQAVVGRQIFPGAASA